MDSESPWQQLRPAVDAWRRARFAAWTTALGIALSSVTVALSALNAISAQQAIAMALPAVLITVSGIAGRIVPDAWIAWRRGFRHGCEAALTSQRQAYLLRADDAGNRVGRDPAGKIDELSRAPVLRYLRTSVQLMDVGARNPLGRAASALSARPQGVAGSGVS